MITMNINIDIKDSGKKSLDIARDQYSNATFSEL